MNALAITQRDDSHGTLAVSDIDEFAKHLRGRLVRRGDADYAGVRAVWNGMIEKQPALIARAQGVADVIEAIRFARKHDLLISVRGGGHNVAGTALCDGGLTIDLSSMKGVLVNASAREAVVQPGATWGDVDRETQLHGLAVPSGIISTTGVPGLTLGGGFGWLSRKHGYTCDNLLEAELVTADGRVLRASAKENADLFWGLRGGGGNFGVVTAFKFRLQPVGPQVMAGMILYPLDKAAEVMQFFRKFTATSPEELGALLVLRPAPPAPFLAKELHGKPVVAIVVCYVGDPEEGARVLKPLKEFGQPLADVIAPKPFTALQAMLDGGQIAGRQYYWKSEYLHDLKGDAIDTLIARAGKLTSPHSAILVFQLGGAVSRVGPVETAASGRDARYIVNIAGAWENKLDNECQVRWVRDTWAALRPFGTGAVYVNFMADDERPEWLHAAYGTEIYQRLASLKDRYDPDNFFRTNQNIRPAKERRPAEVETVR
ncbi:MAG: FAD-binding oxidoreductase [Gammaproteobacteria bacterium]|nr:FAD-binding oxidoreductase [Gammaproteobacteria bacterium]